MAPADQPVELHVVDAAQRHRVDLDVQPGPLRGVEAAHHGWSRSPQRVSSRNLSLSSVSIDTLRRDADRGQVLAVFGELAAVGRQRELVERAAVEMAAEPRISDITFFRTSGSPRSACSLRTPRRTKAVHSRSSSLQRQHLRLGQEGHVPAMQ